MNEQDIKELTAEYEKQLQVLAEKHTKTKSDLYELGTTITEEFKDLQAEMLQRAAQLIEQQASFETTRDFVHQLRASR